MTGPFDPYLRHSLRWRIGRDDDAMRCYLDGVLSDGLRSNVDIDIDEDKDISSANGFD